MKNKKAKLIVFLVIALFFSGCTSPQTQTGPELTPTPSPVQPGPEGTILTQTPTPTPAPQENPAATATPTPALQAETVQAQAGPGGCNTTEECTQYCQQNMAACEQFCMSNPSNKYCGQFWEKPAEMPCKTEEECDVYCSQNPGACGGTGTGGELQLASLPFDAENYSPQYWGLWPFCVHGGDHPEGHGGIDFELEKDSKIYAACDGNVEVIDLEDQAYEHGSGAMINCGAYVAAYSGLSGLLVKQGDSVKKGQQIANPAWVGKEYYIHFEINDFRAEKLRCPSDYIDATFKTELEKMLSKSHYPEKGAEPLLCNCQELPYKTTMKTGP